MIQPERIHPLNDDSPRPNGTYILYWMQASQRSIYNHALEYAADLANKQRLPLFVIFGLTGNYPEANIRHYQFMVEGLRDVRDHLAERGIHFRVYSGSPDEVALATAERARIVVVDRGYLHHQKLWRKEVSEYAGCQVIQVESDVLVPTTMASTKEEFAARTLRPKIHREMKKFIAPVTERELLVKSGIDHIEEGLNLDDPHLLDQFDLDRSISPVREFTGGQTEAERRLQLFIETKLTNYGTGRNDITATNTTELSPYLHFGHISPLRILIQLIANASPSDENVAVLIEELIVRRELAINFVEQNEQYDSYKSLPEWSIKTLDKHREDTRDFLYTAEQLEGAQTHDQYWNAAMNEMKLRGMMKGYMRMYWGKKVIEWSPSPEVAYETLLYLNNKYFLDGRDPNSYANVAWIFGKHDRPWGERPVFGTVRYMNANGLKRKFDIEAYVQWVESLSDGAE
ncbi:MAG: deoxyribodipyrimidine photo-lyase [Ignavibacteriae bacterium]|nr:deoxyribodipyrimidine photo-lyase [Ignavibacteriota bacterium]MCB9216935.1 deoxyribodipyrimidine photo-lyase [Ignavibacteria bacterium]